jgi:alpha-1,6-mannosyltransferase
MVNQSSKAIALSIISLIGYLLIGYYTQRIDTVLLLSCFYVLFLIYLLTIRAEHPKEVNFWISASILFRVCFLFSIPNLSDDFYRFIWDGRLLAHGYHPFSHLPTYYLENKISIPGIDDTLFQKLNSPNYFTIYPPVNQFTFLVATKIGDDSILLSVIVMRIFILASEIGSLVLIKRLLAHYQLPIKNILYYALNPLIIIELSGNLHFEAIMIFFLLLSVWLLIKNRMVWSALYFSLAICTKLLPVIILPLLLARLGIKKFLIYGILVVAFCILAFLPLLNQDIINGFHKSIGYYFTKFEFNASLYYLVREWGFWKYGYNIIQTVGWKLGAWCVGAILLFSFLEGYEFIFSRQRQSTAIASMTIDNGLLTSGLFVFTIYFSFAIVVHPWYISTLLALSLFTKYKFPILWTALIFFTYSGYSHDGFKENLWVVAIEYLAVFGYLAYELFGKREKHHCLYQP